MSSQGMNMRVFAGGLTVDQAAIAVGLKHPLILHDCKGIVEHS